MGNFTEFIIFPVLLKILKDFAVLFLLNCQLFGNKLMVAAEVFKIESRYTVKENSLMDKAQIAIIFLSVCSCSNSFIFY